METFIIIKKEEHILAIKEANSEIETNVINQFLEDGFEIQNEKYKAINELVAKKMYYDEIQFKNNQKLKIIALILFFIIIFIY